jgi:LacI family transcriptional regulator
MNKHGFTLKEISHQAGLSLATIDRVMNARPSVRMATVLRVKQALRELRDQQEQVFLIGRKFMIDVVVEAPDRFSNLLRDSLESELPSLRPAVFRCRFHVAEVFETQKLIKLLKQIAVRGSHGVILKAPDHPDIVAAIDLLAEKGIPVITVVTDIQHARRLAYVGIDNRAAGETAAYLMGMWLPRRKATILVTLSSTGFRGEEEREIGFRKAIRENYRHLSLVEVSGGFGRSAPTADLVGAALRNNANICAAYSVGGANYAVLKAFSQMNRTPHVFIAHDLDADNLSLLKQHKLSAVLHHNLKLDMNTCCRLILQVNGALPRQQINTLSPIQVITPFNVPGQ